MDISNAHIFAIFPSAILLLKQMQKSQLLGKYSAGSTYGPTTSYVINNNLSDYLGNCKYSKVLQTTLYQQNYVAF